MEDYRIGHGFDVHRLAPDQKLILGGVTIPYAMGLLGHSDADVLTHAIMDAMLGAAGLGDIGRHFPDTEEAYRGADSIGLLREVRQKVAAYGYRVVNVDGTIVAQKPRLAPYIEEMRKRLEEALELDAGAVNVKATTTEHLGYTGRGEGIAAHAVCLLKRK